MPLDLEARQNIVYQKSFVAYLDILGFKNLVLKRTRRNKEKLERYFGIINSVIEYIRTIPLKQEISSIVISDSIILSLSQSENKDDNLFKLRQLLIAVGLIQKNLALKDIWLRGAITSGDTYFDASKGQVVGPAYINAFLLEQNLAISPRVIVDTRMINEFGFRSAADFTGHINDYDNDSNVSGGVNYSNWGTTILFNWNYPDGKPVNHIDNDIPLFIDYLSPVIENDNNELLTIINNLENSIYKDSNIYKKFRWVVDYLKSLELREQKNDHIICSEASYYLKNL